MPGNKRRNVVVLCADEMRGDCLGIARHRSDCRTPNLDALLSRGCVFPEHHCVMPKCVPSRISMVTGRYSHTDGFRDIHSHLPFETENLGRILKEQGYGIAVFGINHVWKDAFEKVFDAHCWSPPFDRHWGEDSPFRQPPSERATRPFPEMPSTWEYLGCRRNWFDDLVVECALEFLQDASRWDRPWYVQINLQSPHPPYAVEEPYFSAFPDGGFQPFPHEAPEPASLCVRAQRECRTSTDPDPSWLLEIQRVYYGMISKSDALLGRVVDALEATGRFEDSLVVAFSDHGDYAGQYGLVEKWDTHLCDCLTRTVFGMVGDGIPPGARAAGFSQSIDFLPTVLDWLRLPFPERIHGRSLFPAMFGEPVRDCVFATGGHDPCSRRRFNADTQGKRGPDGKQLTYARYPEAMARAAMVRTGTHKLVVRETGERELYDLQVDPMELRNLAADPSTAPIELELQRRLSQWLLETSPDPPLGPQVGA